jgi:hypothetical protein
LAVFAVGTAARAEEIEAVSGRVSPDYIRAKLPDGTFRPETYAFGKGGYWSGPMADLTVDKMEFTDVARTIAPPLAGQNYLASRDPATTKLLIMVYWGTTYAPEHASDSPVYQHLMDANAEFARSHAEQNEISGRAKYLAGDHAYDEVTVAIAAVQAENRLRDNVNARNATMLGYDSWWEATYDAPNGSAQELRKRDMLNELEEDRYFVVLMAYDFQMLWRQKKHKLLWETRFSVSEHRNQFDRQLAAMALYASKYFGQDSGGLVHKGLPDGRVELGDVKSLGAVPDK